MMKDNIFESRAEALVNPVNTRGVMGAGLALQYKNRYPDMYIKYKEACDNNDVKIGKMNVVFDSGRRIINFPTKDDWRDSSKIEYVENGLKDLIELVKQEQIKSIAIPPLGTGLGGLEQSEVFPLIEQASEEMARNGTTVEFYHPNSGIVHYNSVNNIKDLNDMSNESHHIMTTGHRPDKFKGGWSGYMQTAEGRQMHDDMRHFIRDRVDKHGHVTVHSGMSQGADAIFAWAAISEKQENPDKIALHLDIPFEGQESKWPNDVRRRYNSLRDAADSETVYAEEFSNSAYMIRNRGMVDAANECTAVYNGNDLMGGTRKTVEMIIMSDKPLSHFGGYIHKDGEISRDVYNGMYIPSKSSEKLMENVRVLDFDSVTKEELIEKKKVQDTWKDIMKRGRDSSKGKMNTPELDGLDI